MAQTPKQWRVKKPKAHRVIDPSTMKDDRLLRRGDAAAYLRGLGLRIGETRLATAAVKGDGPVYLVVNNCVYYRPEDLRTWAFKSSAVYTSSSDRRVQQQQRGA